MNRSAKHPAARLTALLATATLLACSTHRGNAPARNGPSGNVVTHEQIARTGARTAWDAVRQTSSFVEFREGNNQGRVRITSRGMASLSLNNQVLFVLDGILLADHSYLESVPAVSVQQIEVLSANRAALRFGTPGGNGAVVVTTMVPAT